MKTMIGSGVARQAGLTLIEVMLSVTFGLMFLLSAMTFLVSGQQSYQSQDSGSRIQENARFAMELIRNSVRMAGFTSLRIINPGYIYRGSCGTVNGVAATNCSDEVATTATSQGDRLAIAMTSPNQEDCLGNDTGAVTTRFTNVFWVEIVDGISSLYCRGYNMDANSWTGTSQPLIDGVDQMQVQYGIFNAATDTVDRYLNATGVEAILPVGSAWENIRSVKVGLLVNAGTATIEAENDASTIDSALLAHQYTDFTILDGTYTRASTDRKLRRVYTSLIAINNVWVDDI